MSPQFTIVSQRPTVAIDLGGLPQRAVEITFKWGAGFIGSVIVNEQTASAETTKALILDYIKRFSVNGE